MEDDHRSAITAGDCALSAYLTGPGPDVRVAFSHDGKRPAFAVKSQHRRTRLLPFHRSDAPSQWRRSSITAAGRAAASGCCREMAIGLRLYPARQRPMGTLAEIIGRGEKVLSSPMIISYTRVVVVRWDAICQQSRNTNENKSQPTVWSRQSRSEQPLTSPSSDIGALDDWSLDGKWLWCRKPMATLERKSGCCPLLPHPTRKRRGERLLRSEIRFVAGTLLPEWPVNRISGRRQLAYFVGIIDLRGARGGWQMDLYNERYTLGRQASLVSRWEDYLLYFGRWWVFQFMGNLLSSIDGPTCRGTFPTFGVQRAIPHDSSKNKSSRAFAQPGQAGSDEEEFRAASGC